VTIRVLIVDDEESIRVTLAEFVKDDRYEIHTAADAEEALRLIEDQPFDVVVTDIVLPRMNGVALLGEIRKRWPDTQVIMLTSDPTVETAAKAMHAGALDYLTKPVTKEAINRVVDNAVRVKQLTDEKRQLEEENKKYQEHLQELVDERTTALREANDIITRSPAVAFLWKNETGWPVEFVSENIRDLFGYSANELLSGTIAYAEIIYPDDLERVMGEIAQYSTEEGTRSFRHEPYRIITKDGEERWINDVTSIRRDPKGVITHYEGMVHDITKRKQAQDALCESEAKYRATFESTGTAMVIIEEDTTLSMVNGQFEELCGYSREEIEGTKTWKEFVVKEDLERMKAYHDARRAEGGQAPVSYEFRLVARDGGIRDIFLTNGIIPGTKRSISSLSDITELKRTEEALQQSKERYRGIVQYQTEGITRWLPDGTLTFVNDAYCSYYGKSRDELIGTHWTEAVAQADREEMLAYAERLRNMVMQGNPVLTTEHREVAAGGEIRWTQWSDHAIFDEKGNLVEFQSSGRDITERKSAQEKERRLLQQQIAMNELSLALGNYVSLQEIYDTLYRYVAELIETDALYISSYNKNEQLIKAEYVRDEYGHIVDPATLPPLKLEGPGHGTQSQAIRSGKPVYIPDILEAMEKIKESYDIASNGTVTRDTVTYSEQEDVLRSELLAPILFKGEVIGVIAVESLRVDAYAQTDLDLLSGLANVAAVAIENAHLQEGLKKTLEDTIRAVGLTTEMRDPYTARHQERVTELACAIARKMRIPEQQIKGIHSAGLLHDIGKIAVPAEILTKPGKLNDLEFSLIRRHPQVAYDILKGIEFPWPIADIVLQHHERMNGSGYPNGLKGDEILLEARILAVADVVEAISSHRPYRAALGLDAALDEIKQGRGTLYDPDVVDTCLGVFEEGFSLD
jgi:PAS domain S-box-containing protein/putative nucleotidyltransferase with HDIG domain